MAKIRRKLQRLLGSIHPSSRRIRIGQPTVNREGTEESHKRTLQELSDLKLALDESSIVAITDRRGIIIEVNDKFCEISQYSRGELIGNTHRIVNSGHHPRPFFQQMWRTIAAGQVWRGEIKNKAKDGTYYWVSTTIVPFMDERGKPYQYVAIRHDITDRIRAEERLAETMQYDFLKLVKNSHCGLFKLALDSDGNIIYTFSEGRIAIESGMTTERIANRPLSQVHKPYIAKRLESYFNRVKQGQIVNIETQYEDKYYYITFSPMEDGGEEITEVIGSIMDITERKKAEEMIHHLAHYDSLTNLPNRLKFANKLTDAIDAAEISGEPIAILFMDLDRFKTINDTLGHSCGDQLLTSVADRLVERFNGSNELISRLGGDEFTFFFYGRTREEAEDIAKELIELMSEPFMLDQMRIYVTPSIGISMYPEDGRELDILLKHADSAMYSAKSKGKNNYQFYSAESDSFGKVRLLLESELHLAIEQEQFFLEYQPIIDIERQKVVAMEALIRWQHPELGIVPPLQFIPLAEENGLIVPIGEWVMREACRQTKAWQDQGNGDLIIAVNISMRQIMQKDFCVMIRDILSETGLAPQYLELEITESMAHDAEYSLRILKQIKELGVNISIDDFGTGYSSLSYLSQFPVDRLKIDQSFVRDLNHGNRFIIKTIIDMATNMDISVVAEGVETSDHIEFLRSHACREVQGYHYSKPLPSEQAGRFIGIDQSSID